MTVLSRPVDENELELRAAGWPRSPSRPSWQPISYPVLSEDRVTRIAREWNTKDAASQRSGTPFGIVAACNARTGQPA